MRFREHDEADDPILSMVNLIDLFLVVIGILLIVIDPLNPFSQDKVVVENPGEAVMRMLVQEGKGGTTLPGQRDRRRAGQPRRVTTACADGRMIYVPEAGRRQVATRTANWDFARSSRIMAGFRFSWCSPWK